MTNASRFDALFARVLDEAWRNTAEIRDEIEALRRFDGESDEWALAAMALALEQREDVLFERLWTQRPHLRQDPRARYLAAIHAVRTGRRLPGLEEAGDDQSYDGAARVLIRILSDPDSPATRALFRGLTGDWRARVERIVLTQASAKVRARASWLSRSVEAGTLSLLDALHLTMKDCLDRGDWERAETEIDTFAASGGAAEIVFHYRGLVAMRRRRWTEALRAFSEVTKFSPGSVFAWRWVLRAALKAREFATARRAQNRLSELGATLDARAAGAAIAVLKANPLTMVRSLIRHREE